MVSDSPGLVDFAIGLVNSVLNLPNGQVAFFLGIQLTEELWTVLIKKFGGLVEMTFGQVKMTFFAPCVGSINLFIVHKNIKTKISYVPD